MFMDWISVVMEKLLFLALHVEGIGTFPKPLSAEEERKCFEEMRQGSEEARGKLVEHNLRLVAHIAKNQKSCIAASKKNWMNGKN